MLWPSPQWDHVTYWALDLETGGLDPRADAILSVGMVPVREGAIRLGEAWSSLVRPETTAHFGAESIRAHQLVPAEVRDAPPLEAVLREIDVRLHQSVLLVHQAAIDVQFLRRACRRAGVRWRDPTVVDTVTLLVKAAKRARFLDPGAPGIVPDLNLVAARQRLGLPDYGQHDALTDAIAAAELFLVLRRRLNAKTLRDLR